MAFPFIKVTRSGWETTLHVVAAILRMPRDPCTLPVCSSVMISEYPVRTNASLLVYYIQARRSLSSRRSNFKLLSITSPPLPVYISFSFFRNKQ